MKKLSLDEFISKAKLIHGDKYDYSSTFYLGGSRKPISFRGWVVHKDI